MGPRAVAKIWPLCKSEKVSILSRGDTIFKLCHLGSGHQDGGEKDLGGKNLAKVLISQGHSSVFRLCKLLQKVYQEFQ